jgi:DNA-binding NtrC family response regulator
MLAWGGEEELTVDALERALASPAAESPFPEELLEGRDLGELHRDLDIAWLRKRFLALGSSMSALAASLRMNRSSLYRWLKRLGVKPGTWR